MHIVSVNVAEFLGTAQLPAPAEGERLAEHVLGLDRNAKILVDFSTISGLTTGFGYAFFRVLFSAMPPDDVRSRVDLRMRSAFQREVIRRGLHAALNEASAHKLG